MLKLRNKKSSRARGNLCQRFPRIVCLLSSSFLFRWCRGPGSEKSSEKGEAGKDG